MQRMIKLYKSFSLRTPNSRYRVFIGVLMFLNCRILNILRIYAVELEKVLPTLFSELVSFNPMTSSNFRSTIVLLNKLNAV